VSHPIRTTAARSANDDGRGALPRDRRRTSNEAEHGPSGDHRSPITEPEKTILGRATPVARERAPTGCIRGPRSYTGQRLIAIPPAPEGNDGSHTNPPLMTPIDRR
jgi:hypothetical protein